MRTSSTALAVALALTITGSLVPSAPARAAADPAPKRSFVTNGPVETVVRSGDTVYIGGRFNRLGPRTGPGLGFALDGSAQAGLPEVTGGGGVVQAVASDGSGGWFIAGMFSHVGGVARNNIAHILADRSVDPAFDPNANDGIHAMAVSGSTVYVGGLFTSVGGQTRNRIAGLSVASGLATAFNPDADAAVEALAISDSGSIVYAGGRFTTIGGTARKNIAGLNVADGTAVLTFNPTSDGIVLALAISGSTLYAGGYFTVIGGQRRSNIAALNAGGTLDGTAVLTFDPSSASGTCTACGGVSALALSPSGSMVYAGGLFTIIGGQNRRYLAALNAADGTATAFNPNPNGNILGLTVSVDGATVYAAGGFNSFDGLPSIGGQVRNYLAAISAADGTATGFDPNPNSAALVVGVSGSAVYVGGSFSSIGGVVRNGIAAINAADGTATTFDPSARFGANNATVYTIVVSGSTVYVGGFFTSIGGQPRNYIAALDAADGTATSWNPGASSIVETLALSGSTLYAGGWFTSIGGQPRNLIAGLNLSDGSATAFNPNANGGVAEIKVSGSLVYAGGYFTSIGGQTRNKIAALNAADGSATAWNPDATATANVLSLAISGPTIYAGGNFTTIGGLARRNIAALNVSDGLATAFDPQANDGVFAVAVTGSGVYAAGVFSAIGGQTRHLLAELDPADGTATGFDPGGDPGFIAFALTVAQDGTLYVGGSFRTFDLAFQQGIASFAGPLPNLAPTASLSVNIAGGGAPLAVTLDASASSDPDGAATIAGYTFDPGDGTGAVTQATPTRSHTYTSAGSYTATVSVTDVHGLQSSNTASVQIDVVPPPPVIVSPTEDAALNDASVTISGVTAPDMEVRIADGVSVLGTTTADASGRFSASHTFADGRHGVTATVLGGSGDPVAVSAVRAFSVDTLAPGAPVITAPGAGATAANSFVTFSGSAEPGAVVRLLEGPRTVASVLADASGTWTVSAGFASGTHVVTATATDASGNASAPSGARTFEVTDVAAPGAPVIVSPAQASTVEVSPVVVSGSAEPGAAVEVREGATSLGSTSADASGTWRHVLFALTAGAHTINAIATDPAGNVGNPSSPRSFSMHPPATTGSQITSPGPGSVHGGYVAFAGTGAKPGTAVSLFDGSTRAGMVMSGPDGTWTMGVEMSPGAHSIVATSDGVASSAPVSFTVDVQGPVVAITTPARTVFLPGDVVQIAGTASDNLSVVGVTVTYRDVLDRVVATQVATCACAPGATSVTWTADPSLPSGTYTAIAQGIDEAGNRSTRASTSFLTI